MEQGDLDLPSGQIEQTELDGVLQNWGFTFPGGTTGNPASLPEPATAGILTPGVECVPRTPRR